MSLACILIAQYLGGCSNVCDKFKFHTDYAAALQQDKVGISESCSRSWMGGLRLHCRQ